MEADDATTETPPVTVKTMTNTVPATPPGNVNTTLLYIRPKCYTLAVRNAVENVLKSASQQYPSLRIRSETLIAGERVARRKLVDGQHRSVARFATQTDPSRFPIPRDIFQKKFKESWSDVLEEGRAMSAMQAMTKTGASPEQMEDAWGEAEKDGRVLHASEDAFCGLLTLGGRSNIYVLNGHYVALRGTYVQSESAVAIFVVEFEENELSWLDFIANVVGDANPDLAKQGTMRRTIRDRHDELDLEQPPQLSETGGIHASASPLEAIAERCNWLTRSNTAEDEYARVLIARGIPEAQILDWFDNPLVQLPPGSESSATIPERKLTPIFTYVKGVNTSLCTKRLLEVYDHYLFANGGDSSGGGCCTIL